jgi:hypothetical protein
MNVLVAAWLFGALLSLFFAWILGHMQRGDARIRTERLLALEERSVAALAQGEVNATRGELAVATGSEPLASPVDGMPCVFFDLQLTREGSARGKAAALETLHQERRSGALDLVGSGGARVRLELDGALIQPREGVVTRELEWRDSDWSAAGWQAGGWLDAERRHVESLGIDLCGELDVGVLRLHYQQLRPGDEALVIGEVRWDPVTRVSTLGSSARFQLELSAGSLVDYQRAQRTAHSAMRRASRWFVGLAAVFVALAGLSFAGVLG